MFTAFRPYLAAGIFALLIAIWGLWQYSDRLRQQVREAEMQAAQSAAVADRLRITMDAQQRRMEQMADDALAGSS